MKKNAFVCLAALLAACGDGEIVRPAEKPAVSGWGRPLSAIEYEDAYGDRVFSTTTWYYDSRGRLTGYLRTNNLGQAEEEMSGSVFEGDTHTYTVGSWEWIGGPQPVEFLYTDTYADESFSTLNSRYMRGQNMAWRQTVTYRYRDGRRTGYLTVDDRSTPYESRVEEFDTRITYFTDPSPSPSRFPGQAAYGDQQRVEMVFTDGEGNRTGYYNDNDYGRAQWDFTYGDGFCTYLTTSGGGFNSPHLVRLTFLPE